MFGLSMNSCRVNGIRSYEHALEIWDRAERRRNNPDMALIPGKRGSRVMHMHRRGRSVAFRYHSTDVVMWHDDNTYSLDCWGSHATDIFANRFLPPTHVMTKASSALMIDDLVYPIRHEVRVHADGQIVETRPLVFERQAIDRDRAKEVLAQTPYAEYRDWYNVTWPMVRASPPAQRPFVSKKDAIAALERRDVWLTLLWSAWGKPDEIRMAIYDEADCYKPETRPTLPRSADLNRWSVADAH